MRFSIGDFEINENEGDGVGCSSCDGNNEITMGDAEGGSPSACKLFFTRCWLSVEANDFVVIPACESGFAVRTSSKEIKVNSQKVIAETGKTLVPL